MLADLGMEVIKIETVDDQVAFGPGSRTALAHDSLNRNKRSIALDLKSDDGQQVFYDLVKTSDAVLEGSRPGVAKRLGVDYDTLKQINPRIVYCSISGYGQDGPWATVGAHDTEASASRGAFGHTPDGVITPSVFGVLLADIGGGLQGAVGILAGLLSLPSRGDGCFIDLALADSVSTFHLPKLQQVLMTGQHEQTAHLDYGFFECQDGKYLAQASVEPQNWARWCKAIGRVDLLGLPQAQGEERKRMIAEMRETMKTKPRDEWFAKISATGATVAPCLELEEVVKDPQIKHRGMIWEAEHPTEGRVRQWGYPLLVKEAPARLAKFAPSKGEDTGAILQEIGYDEQKIASLTDSGVVRQA